MAISSLIFVFFLIIVDVASKAKVEDFHNVAMYSEIFQLYVLMRNPDLMNFLNGINHLMQNFFQCKFPFKFWQLHVLLDIVIS